MKEELKNVLHEYFADIKKHNKKIKADPEDMEAPYPVQPSIEGLAIWLDKGEIEVPEGMR